MLADISNPDASERIAVAGGDREKNRHRARAAQAREIERVLADRPVPTAIRRATSGEVTALSGAHPAVDVDRPGIAGPERGLEAPACQPAARAGWSSMPTIASRSDLCSHGLVSIRWLIGHARSNSSESA